MYVLTVLCYVCNQPPRSAHPVVNFSCVPCEPVVIENLPFDKYELEPSPLTQYILERRQPNVAWQVTYLLCIFVSYLIKSSVCIALLKPSFQSVILPFVRRRLSCGDCLDNNKEDYQNFSVLYCESQ